MKSNILALFLIFIIINTGCAVSYSFDDAIDQNSDTGQIKDIYVDPVNGQDIFKGDSVESPKRSIKSAVCEFEKTSKLGEECVIHLAMGQYTGENNQAIYINGNRKNKIIFAGISPKDTVIDAKSAAFVFNSKCSLEIYNLTIKNGKSKNSAVTAPIVYTENCYFICNEGKHGGALYSSHVCDIRSCLFENNIAREGGAIKCEGTCNIVSSNFINNTAKKNGGAIYHDNTVLTIHDSGFESNKADRHGGAVYTQGSKKNIAPTLVKYCVFNGNIAGEYGGALYKDSKNIDLNLIHCEFIDNKGECGGAVFLDGPVFGWIFLNAYGTVFQYNQAIENGGAVYFKDAKWEDNNLKPDLIEDNTPQDFVFH